MRLEARQETMRSSLAVHLDLVGHVSVRSENPGLLSAYTKVSLGRAPRPRGSGKASALPNPPRRLARRLQSRRSRASGKESRGLAQAFPGGGQLEA